MTPDPVYDQLAAFTPASALDPAEVLFRAGRASARTPWVWKLAAAGLVLTNMAAVGALTLRRPEVVTVPAPVAPPAAIPETVVPEPTSEPSPGSGLLARRSDPDHWPRPAAGGIDYPPDYPLTLAEARRAKVE